MWHIFLITIHKSLPGENKIHKGSRLSRIKRDSKVDNVQRASTEDGKQEPMLKCQNTPCLKSDKNSQLSIRALCTGRGSKRGKKRRTVLSINIIFYL